MTTEATALDQAASSNATGIVKRGNAYFIDPHSIVREEGFNTRFDFGDIEALAASIKENGVENPIRVRRSDTPGKFVLINGDRRLTAVELLISQGVSFPDGIPAMIEAKTISEESQIVKMLVDNQGKEFLPLEKAVAFGRLRDEHGWSVAQIAKQFGMHETSVRETLLLLGAGEELQEAVKEGKVGATTASYIVRQAKGDVEKQKELVKQAETPEGKRAITAPKIRRRIKTSSGVSQPLSPTKISDQLAYTLVDLEQICAKIGMDAEKIAEMPPERRGDHRAIFIAGIVHGLRVALGQV